MSRAAASAPQGSPERPQGRRQRSPARLPGAERITGVMAADPPQRRSWRPFILTLDAVIQWEDAEKEISTGFPTMRPALHQCGPIVAGLIRYVSRNRSTSDLLNRGSSPGENVG